MTSSKRQKQELDSASKERKIPFTVASALLRELGERLVGKPHIALAELVKNSYDADAKKVIIRFEPDKIEVIDNGHGMDENEFENFWMRIGSPHKQAQRLSRGLHRPMTGSKGVGRLAAQFLANKLELHTVSNRSPQSEIIARVDWDEAIKAGELIKAEALWRTTAKQTQFPDGESQGTLLVLSELNQTWGETEIRDLAKEIWPLQPPFRSNSDLPEDQPSNFAVNLESAEQKYIEGFDSQMRAGFSQWEARIVGKLIDVDPSKNPLVKITAEIKDKRNELHKFLWEYEADSRYVRNVEFEIRVFRRQGRMKAGIKIEELREYLDKHGGVHIYDSGFHLPYYGSDTDWLGLERDHAARIGKSELLPEDLQVTRGLQFLPTQRRIFGVVHINTNKERAVAVEDALAGERRKRGSIPRNQEREIKREVEKKAGYLKIQVTRDRLTENKALETLSKIVRTAIDYYAIQAQILNQQEIDAGKRERPATEKFERVEKILDFYQGQIPEPIFDDLRSQIEEAIETSKSEAEQMVSQLGLMGSLATAGISALAFEHEISKQLNLLTSVAEEIVDIEVKDAKIRDRLAEVGKDIKEWVERARATQALFSHLTNEEDRDLRAKFKAGTLIERVEDQIRFLLRGVEIETDGINPFLRLPEGSFAEWSAIFQNVFVNAVNAMLDSKSKRIVVSSLSRGKTKIIVIQDTGSGVDLSTADELFKPFVRKLKISPEKRQLGMGGTGLGLTIVKMIAGNLNCKVRFVEPEKPFKTAFQISWTEK